MGTDQIMYCIVALILGMLLANMLKSVCGCKNVVEGGGPFNIYESDHVSGCWESYPMKSAFDMCESKNWVATSMHDMTHTGDTPPVVTCAEVLGYINRNKKCRHHLTGSKNKYNPS
jgi:hypothetical protein